MTRGPDAQNRLRPYLDRADHTTPPERRWPRVMGILSMGFGGLGLLSALLQFLLLTGLAGPDRLESVNTYPEWFRPIQSVSWAGNAALALLLIGAGIATFRLRRGGRCTWPTLALT